jgi:hypothetical protein
MDSDIAILIQAPELIEAIGNSCLVQTDLDLDTHVPGSPCCPPCEFVIVCECRSTTGACLTAGKPPTRSM